MGTDSNYQKAYKDAEKVAKQIIEGYCQKNSGNSPSDDFSDIPEVTNPIQDAYTEGCKKYGIDIKRHEFGVNCLYTVWKLAGHKTR
jgi:hypothetical protein